MSIFFEIMVRIASYRPQIDQSHDENRLSHIIMINIIMMMMMMMITMMMIVIMMIVMMMMTMMMMTMMMMFMKKITLLGMARKLRKFLSIPN